MKLANTLSACGLLLAPALLLATTSLATLPPGAAAEELAGASAQTDEFKARLELQGTPGAGKPAKARVVLEAQKPYKCNKEYPYKFKVLKLSDGLTTPSDVLKDLVYSEASSSLEIPFTAAKAGKHSIEGEFRFSVCTKETCRVLKETLRLEFEVR